MSFNYKKITKAPNKEKIESFVIGYEEELKEFIFSLYGALVIFL